MNFKLEKWSPDFAEDISKHANNPKIAINLRDSFPNPYFLENAIEYINFVLIDNNTFSRAILIDGEAVGSVAISIKEDVHSKSAELGYWLGEDYWNKGIMTKVIKEFTNLVFNETDIVRIFAEPFSYNLSSKKVLEKVGFNLEGIKLKNVYKNGKFYDSYLYSLIK
ncbi:GNAT family N-acetyltransferase [Methanobrevibacter sp. DSM 116169]|uniref:GNAT family N-acetyltransferase n=1 Tax=Methanobrevibacter sp. DSM 116169 TaxID=3242727 RepID=UPI0038FC5592